MRLSLVPTTVEKPARLVEGWLFTSANPGLILEELSRHGIEITKTSIFHFSIGYFVVLNGQTQIQPSAVTLPYSRLADNVFAPLDAEPNAEVSADEWKEMFPIEKCFVWHPSAGLFSFLEKDGNRAVNLLLAPRIKPGNWDRAIPGTGFNGRIISIFPEMKISLHNIWEEESAEIGAAPASLVNPDRVDRSPPAGAEIGAAHPRMPGDRPLSNGKYARLPQLRWIALGLLILIALATVGWWFASGPTAMPVQSGTPVSAPQSKSLEFFKALSVVGLMAVAVLAAYISYRNFKMLVMKENPFNVILGWIIFAVFMSSIAVLIDTPIVKALMGGFCWGSVISASVWFIKGLIGTRYSSVISNQRGSAITGQNRNSSKSAGQKGVWSKQHSWGGQQQSQQKTQRVHAQASENLHDREVRRLLHLLDSDPDAGLRFAFPMVGKVGRGTDLPASGLGEGRIDYGSNSGGSSGYIHCTSDQRLALTRRYHELANREIGLGRHRRAAYIYAFLLDEHAMAARTLLDGGHFREAAVLYEEKLGKLREAAEALHKGGLLSEAIILYERLGEHEIVGDLARLLGQEDRAVAAYRRAVEARLAVQDALGAARILDLKLRATDEAIDRLTESWPNSSQAVACITEAFCHFGRLGRHDAAKELVRRVAWDGRADANLARTVFGLLPTIARNYLDQVTRRLIADETRLLAADALRKMPTESFKSDIMYALRSLEPGDQLLDRDTRRYQMENRPKPAAGKRGSDRIVYRGTVSLPKGEWSSFVSAGSSLVAAGLIGRQLALVRYIPGGGGAQLATRSNWHAGIEHEESAFNHPVFLAVSGSLGRAVIQMPLAFAINGIETLPTYDDLGPLVVGSHPAFAARGEQPLVAGMAFVGESTFDLLRCRVNQDCKAEWIRERYDTATETLLGSWIITNVANIKDRLPAANFCKEMLYVEGDGLIIAHDWNGKIWHSPMHRRIIRLCPSPYDCLMLAVSFHDEGGVIIRGNDYLDGPWTAFGAGLHAPHCCFVSNEILVATSTGVVEVYDLRNGKVSLLATHRDANLKPVAIASFNSRTASASFAILGACGNLFMFGVGVPGQLGGVFWADTSSLQVYPWNHR